MEKTQKVSTKKKALGWGFHQQNWMAFVAVHNPKAKLRDLRVPGTHNSASSTITSTFSSFARCQDLSITEQLCSGVRFFDIRCGRATAKNQGHAIHHGPFAGGSIIQVFKDIVAFAKDHPKEFIIVDLINESGRQLRDGQKLDLFTKVAKLVSGIVVKATDLDYKKFLAKSATIGKVSSDKRCLMILIDEDFYEPEDPKRVHPKVKTLFSNLPSMGFLNRKEVIESTWHDEENKNELLRKNRENCLNSEKQKEKYIVHQMTMTPSFKGISDTLKNYKKFNPSIKSKELIKDKSLHKLLGQDKFLGKDIKLNWNIVWFDFVDTVPILVDYLVGLNFPYPLVIKKAIVHTAMTADSEPDHSLDRKKVIQDLVKGRGRGNSLFLVDLVEDLKLEKIKFKVVALQIDYQFGDKSLGISGDAIDCGYAPPKALHKNEMFLFNFTRVREC